MEEGPESARAAVYRGNRFGTERREAMGLKAGGWCWWRTMERCLSGGGEKR